MTETESALRSIRERIYAMGARFDKDVLSETQALYEGLVATSDPDVQCIADLAYGAHPRQRLDIYRGPARRAPVLVFFPGGGFTGGGKDEHPAFYRNLGVYFARHGYLTIVANYRLAPEFTWPDQTADIAAAVDWARQNATTYGGDPGQLFLMGQSAGAANLASFLFHPKYADALEAAGVRRAILMSGVYRFHAGLPASVHLYTGAPDLWEDRSPLTHVAGSRVPVSLSIAEYDPEVLASPTLELALALTARDGKCPPLRVFSGHNHVSTVQSLGSLDDDVGAALLAALRGEGAGEAATPTPVASPLELAR